MLCSLRFIVIIFEFRCQYRMLYAEALWFFLFYVFFLLSFIVFNIFGLFRFSNSLVILKFLKTISKVIIFCQWKALVYFCSFISFCVFFLFLLHFSKRKTQYFLQKRFLLGWFFFLSLKTCNMVIIFVVQALQFFVTNSFLFKNKIFFFFYNFA